MDALLPPLHTLRRALPAALVAALTLAACQDTRSTSTPAPTASEARPGPPGALDAVQRRGRLRCGLANGASPLSDIDASLCRAVAAAVLGDASAVELVSTSGDAEFAGLIGGRIDVDFGRDGAIGPVVHSAPTYFDGVGLMARSGGPASIAELDGAGVCVAQADVDAVRAAFAASSIRVDWIVRAGLDAAATRYEAGACAAVAGRRSELAAWRATASRPHEHAVFARPLVAAPFRAAVPRGDPRWLNVVDAVIYATIAAEEFGVTSGNIASASGSSDARVRLLVGADGVVGLRLGLSRDWAARLVRQVGNYGEFYNQALGPGSDIELERGPNEVWTRGGLLYAPPFR